jgi:YD repeat-containing protein
VAGDYILSYWAKEGSAPWSYRQKSLANYQPGGAIATDVVNGYIDEVRVYPKGATMTTYTYEPLLGVTSMTDANNVTAHYEYDTFGRLSCIRDQDNNILECYDYQYRQEIPFAVHQQ